MIGMDRRTANRCPPDHLRQSIGDILHAGRQSADAT